VAVRVSSGPSFYVVVVVVVYRPGSSPVTAAFFSEPGDVLDRLSTSLDPVVLSCDVTIRQERTADQYAIEFCQLSAGYSLRAKLPIQTPAMDMLYNTTNEQHQRTSSQQFYNKFATSQCQSPTSRHVKMLGCGKFLSVGGESFYKLLLYSCCELVRWWCSLVVFVAGVRRSESRTTAHRATA